MSQSNWINEDGLPRNRDLTEPNNRHRKKPRKKRFIIESRYSGKISWMRHEWSVWGRYETEKAREQALATLRKKQNWEFRPV